jgi:hypothetical protein
MTPELATAARWSLAAAAAILVGAVAVHCCRTTDFRWVVAALVASLLLAAWPDAVRLAEELDGYEDEGDLPDAAGSTNSSAAGANVRKRFRDFAELPRRLKDTIGSGLDALAQSVQMNREATPQGQGHADQSTDVTLSQDMYRSDRLLLDDVNVFDVRKYERMAGEYAAIQYFMCSLRGARAGLHNLLMRALAQG